MPVFTRASGSGLATTPANTDKELGFIWVYNSETSTTLASGNFCVWDTTAADGFSVKQVSATNQAAIVAGAVPYGESITAGSWGRLQVYGYHAGVTAATTVAAGNHLVTDGGTLAGSCDDAAASTVRSFGFFMSSSTSNVAPAFLYCV